MMRVLVPLGTRPEIIKLSPVVAALVAAGFDVHTLATGQHYDASLTDTFFTALGVTPDQRWVLEGDEGQRVGTILTMAYREIGRVRPDVVLVLGDTYTVPLLALAARRHGVPVVHLEAGLRSFNDTSMEEVNRRMGAAAVALHLAPTELAGRLLRAEGVAPERIRVVGNPIIDVLRSLGMAGRPVPERAGVLVTAHRPTNVDDPARLARVVDLVCRVADEVGHAVFPVHPRTQARLESSGLLAVLERGGIELLPPVPYPRMLDLLCGARLVLTDSGGLQEEASFLGVPVVVLRRSTPRWEGVAAGTSVLVGLDAELAVQTARRLVSPEEQHRVAAVPCPYGDGATAPRVVDVLADPATAELLRLREPDFVGQRPPG
jgi:UDP-N-acetylglucosamine 2-epimerase (non-hydrolysing)